jgi:hypothetical protein
LFVGSDLPVCSFPSWLHHAAYKIARGWRLYQSVC